MTATACTPSGRLVRPAGAPPLVLRAQADPATLRATADWTRAGAGWRSSNGWEVRRARLADLSYAWAAFAPDGIGEWWAHDAATAMERAEGQR